MIMILKKTIPSHSHNAPFSEELGEHWPAGQQFKLWPLAAQKRLKRWSGIPENRTLLSQIGGEEVMISIPTDRMAELFERKITHD